MKISISYQDKTVEYKKEVRKGIFGVVNPDYEQRWTAADDVKDPRNIYHVSRVTRNGTAYWAKSKSGDPIGFGAPATARFTYPEYVEFTKDFQFFIYNMCSKESYQSEIENKKSFASLFRDNVMMTDYAGTWSRADYINNNGKEPYIMLKPMVCGGTLLKIVGETKIAGVEHWLVEGMNKYDFPKYDNTKTPWLFFRPIISVRQWYFDKKGNILKKEEHYAEPFPQFNGGSILPVLGVRQNNNSSTGYVNAIQKHRVRILKENEEVPNPFILRFGKTRKNPYENF